MAESATNQSFPGKGLRVKDTSTPVVVVSLATYGPLCLVRSLGRLGITVYGIQSGRAEAAHYSRYLRKSWKWNFPHRQEGALESLEQVARELGRRAILIPTSDETSMLVAENEGLLRQWYEFPKQPPALPRRLADKKEMYFLARQLGIPTPETAFPQNRDDVERFGCEAKFPLMLKAIDGARSERRSGQKMVIVGDMAELLRQYDVLEDPDEPNFMLQEYIPGGDDTIWMFNGYFNEQSDCLYGATGKKLRQQPVNRGFTSLGICLKNEAVMETTKRLMKAVGYRGILDIGYRWDARDDQYKVLDINPRIGATFRLFAAENGLDAARALYLDLTGQGVPEYHVQEGRKWMVEVPDIKSCLEYRRRGELSVRQWLGSYRGVQETGYFAWDDILPFVVVMLKSAFNAVKNLFAKRSAQERSRSRTARLAVQQESQPGLHAG